MRRGADSNSRIIELKSHNEEEKVRIAFLMEKDQMLQSHYNENANRRCKNSVANCKCNINYYVMESTIAESLKHSRQTI